MANKEALRALQQRLAERLQTVRDQAPSRNWLAVEIAGHGFLMPLEQAGEIFPLAPAQHVPHSQPWFLGVANLRGQLHGVVDAAMFLGLSERAGRSLSDVAARDAGRLVALNTALQLNVALLIDRLLGLRNASMLKPAAREASAGKPHFIGQAMADEQGRVWYELDLAALSADEAFLKIDV
ncbi:MAG: chemotaxis protein CheW [Aquabacterium sp.]|jgi:twitching motility protein PilI|uniref:chemotaxis protein CheW n=1 Tax=Aquabacterium sp. TaxID=1872578 RepID=UPI002A35CFC4|nr:chemotaxis protein CheW [Aquabacterium sp.]MDX9843028.1 chemotaxis protein CheW [Aquabacterium sp.]